MWTTDGLHIAMEREGYRRRGEDINGEGAHLKLRKHKIIQRPSAITTTVHQLVCVCVCVCVCRYHLYSIATQECERSIMMSAMNASKAKWAVCKKLNPNPNPHPHPNPNPHPYPNTNPKSIQCACIMGLVM